MRRAELRQGKARAKVARVTGHDGRTPACRVAFSRASARTVPGDPKAPHFCQPCRRCPSAQPPPHPNCDLAPATSTPPRQARLSRGRTLLLAPAQP